MSGPRAPLSLHSRHVERRPLSLVADPRLALQRTSSDDVTPLPGGPDVDSFELLSVWLDWLNASYAPATVEGYWNAVMRFLTANPVPIVLVTEAIVAQWIETFPYRSSRRVTYFHALRNLFSWCVRNGHMDRDPTAGIRVPSPEEKEPRALTREEFEAVRQAAYRHSPVRGYAVDLLYYSAGRIGEVTHLTWDRITTQGVIFAQTKSGKERLVPWSQGLRNAVEGLRSHFGEQERVLPRAEQTVWQWVRDAGADAGVQRVHPHLFRASAATAMSRGGAELVVVGKILGHAKISTTQRYVAVSRTEKAKAVQLL